MTTRVALGIRDARASRVAGGDAFHLLSHAEVLRWREFFHLTRRRGSSLSTHPTSAVRIALATGSRPLGQDVGKRLRLWLYCTQRKTPVRGGHLHDEVLGVGHHNASFHHPVRS